MFEQPGWTPWPSKEPDKDQWERELQFAGRLHTALLQPRIVEASGVTMYGYTAPHYLVGGDYFDFFQLPDGRLRVIIADIMGKGFGAGMLVMMMHAAARLATPQCPTPSMLLKQINDSFYHDLQAVGSFITALCVDYDPASHTLTAAGAGHPAPLLLRHAGAEPEQLKARGVSLGMMPNRTYQELSVTMSPGNRILLYTDGIVEAKDAAGKDLTVGGLIQMVSANQMLKTPALLQEVLEGVAAHTGGQGPRDDVTVVALQFGNNP